eukprot:2661222-Rhodomonas_salina.5
MSKGLVPLKEMCAEKEEVRARSSASHGMRPIMMAQLSHGPQSLFRCPRQSAVSVPFSASESCCLQSFCLPVWCWRARGAESRGAAAAPQHAVAQAALRALLRRACHRAAQWRAQGCDLVTCKSVAGTGCLGS